VPQATPTTPVEVADLLDSTPHRQLAAVHRRSLRTDRHGAHHMWMAGRLLHLDRIEGRV